MIFWASTLRSSCLIHERVNKGKLMPHISSSISNGNARIEQSIRRKKQTRQDNGNVLEYGGVTDSEISCTVPTIFPCHYDIILSIFDCRSPEGFSRGPRRGRAYCKGSQTARRSLTHGISHFVTGFIIGAMTTLF